MKTRMAVMFIMSMLLIGISAPADADVLCANPSGSVFVRTQCKGNETGLDPVALGLVGPQGPVGPVGPVGPQGPQGEGIPSGAVMHFNLTTCPSGWTALTSAQGRYIVGTAPGEEVGETVGFALSFAENRPAGRHAHALYLDFNDAFVAYHTTFLGIIDNGPVSMSGSVPGFVDSPGQNSNFWHYTQGATNEAGETGGVDGTPAPYIQLLVCQKD